MSLALVHSLNIKKLKFSCLLCKINNYINNKYCKCKRTENKTIHINKTFQMSLALVHSLNIKKLKFSCLLCKINNYINNK